MKTRLRAARWMAAVLFFTPTLAWANLEPSALYDARSMGMGGTGVASLDSAAAPFHNPAGLASIESSAYTLALTPLLSNAGAPFLDPGTGGSSQLDTGLTGGPLMLFGAGYRVASNVVVGATGFLTAGTGATFAAIPTFGNADASFQVFSGEFQVPVAWEITEALSVGVAWRGAFSRLSTTIPAPADPNNPAAGFVVPEATLSDFNPLGVQVGVRYQVAPWLRLGLSYRSKMAMSLTGDATVNGQTSAAPAQSFNLPHTFKLGSAWYLMKNKLNLALDLKYWMYEEAFPANPDAGQIEPFQDSYSAAFGAEYFVTPRVPLRVGFAADRSSTSLANAQPFIISPGTILTGTVGGGLRLENWDIDAGAGYATTSATSNTFGFVPSGAAGEVIPTGEYSFSTVFVALSATLRI